MTYLLIALFKQGILEVVANSTNVCLENRKHNLQHYVREYAHKTNLDLIF